MSTTEFAIKLVGGIMGGIALGGLGIWFVCWLHRWWRPEGLEHTVYERVDGKLVSEEEVPSYIREALGNARTENKRLNAEVKELLKQREPIEVPGQREAYRSCEKCAELEECDKVPTVVPGLKGGVGCIPRTTDHVTHMAVEHPAPPPPSDVAQAVRELTAAVERVASQVSNAVVAQTVELGCIKTELISIRRQSPIMNLRDITELAFELADSMIYRSHTTQPEETPDEARSDDDS